MQQSEEQGTVNIIIFIDAEVTIKAPETVNLQEQSSENITITLRYDFKP